MTSAVHTRLSGPEPILLDGATGTEIRRLGGTMDERVWCAIANETDPEIVRTVHESYLLAGADVITSNTFATARHVLDSIGRGADAAALTRGAVELAIQARDRVDPDREILIAGSMSNTVAWIPGTFSADPRFLPTREQEIDNYREMAAALAEAGIDLIVLEMMLDRERAPLAIEAASETGLPLWIGMSASLGRNNAPIAWDPVREEAPERIAAEAGRRPILAFHDLADHLLGTAETASGGTPPAAAGVMHSTVEATDVALAELRRRWNGPLLAYPETTAGHAVEPDELARRCTSWVADGVKIVGGCCGTTPRHVAAIAEALGRQPSCAHRRSASRCARIS